MKRLIRQIIRNRPLRLFFEMIFGAFDCGIAINVIFVPIEDRHVLPMWQVSIVPKKITRDPFTIYTNLGNLVHGGSLSWSIPYQEKAAFALMFVPDWTDHEELQYKYEEE